MSVSCVHSHSTSESVCACMRACVRACMRAWVRACVCIKRERERSVRVFCSCFELQPAWTQGILKWLSWPKNRVQLTPCWRNLDPLVCVYGSACVCSLLACVCYLGVSGCVHVCVLWPRCLCVGACVFVCVCVCADSLCVFLCLFVCSCVYS